MPDVERGAKTNFDAQQGAQSPLAGWALVSAGLLIAFELCWVMAGYRSVMGFGDLARLPVGMLVLSGIMAVSYALASILEQLRLIKNLRLGLYGLCLWLSLWVGSAALLSKSSKILFIRLFDLEPGAVLMFFFVLWMWQRGLSLARRTLQPEVAWRRFQLGLAAFLLIIFALNFYGGEPPGLGWFMLLIFLGFLAILSARAAYVNIGAGERKNPLDRGWIGGMAAFLGLVVVLTAILGSALTGQWSLLLDWLAAGLRALLAAFLFLSAIPALVIGTLFGWFMAWLRKALGISDVDLTPQPGDELFSLEGLDLPPPETQALPAYVQSLLFWGVTLVVIVGIFVMLRRRAERWRRPDFGDIESLLEPGEARKLLHKAVQDAAGDLLARLRPKPPPPDLHRVRKIYIQLLMRMADLGSPRPPTKTPSEFQPVMAQVMSDKIPDVDGELAQITGAYLRVRYGEEILPEAEMGQVESAWSRIEKIFGQRP